MSQKVKVQRSNPIAITPSLVFWHVPRPPFGGPDENGPRNRNHRSSPLAPGFADGLRGVGGSLPLGTTGSDGPLFDGHNGVAAREK